MKKLILAGTLLISLSIMGKAQVQATQGATPASSPVPHGAPPTTVAPENMAESRTKYMETQLTLTPEQRKKAYDAELGFAKVVIGARTPGAHPDRSAMGQAVSARDAEYQKMLTPTQWTKYETFMPKAPTHSAPGAPGTPPAQK
jgi:hypothetical protein